MWAIATAILASTTVITEIINKKLNPNGVWKQVISWTVSIVLTVIAYFSGSYEFPGIPYITVPVTGLVVGLASNGFYDIPYVKDYVRSLTGFLIPAETSKTETSKK